MEGRFWWLWHNRLYETTPVTGYGFIHNSKRLLEAIFWYAVIIGFIIFTAYNVQDLVEEIPIPSCGSEQVLVKVSAAGVNPIDILYRDGTFPPKELPFTPGFDAAGTIEAVGDKVTKFKKGDRVFCSQMLMGAYAEYALVGENTCWNLQTHVSFNQGAAMGIPYCTAYRSLFQRADARPGNTVLVHGASGAVGTAAVQVCKALGIRVFGTAGTSDGLKLIRELGVDQAFNHRDKTYVDKIKEAAGSGGIKVILEIVAEKNLATDLDLLAVAGTVVVIGCHEEIKINPFLTMAKETNICGVALLFSTKPSEWSEMGNFFGAGLANGTISPIIDKEYSLEHSPDAHTDIVEHKSGSKGNIIITP